MRSARSALRQASAQHAGWLRLRARVLGVLKEHSASLESTRAVLQSFDALPYSVHPQPNVEWLPSTEQLSCDARGIKPAFEAAGLSALDVIAKEARTERQALSHGMQDTAMRDDQLVSMREEAMRDDNQQHHRVAISISGTRLQCVELPSNEHGAALHVLGMRVRWLRRAHAARAYDRDEGMGAAQEDAFRQRLYTMLCRYDSLGGGHAGAGSQAAVPAGVYDALESWARVTPGTAIEAFGSPLNHRITALVEAEEDLRYRPGRGRRRKPPPADAPKIPTPWFCGAFADVDAPFGGRGSFFELRALPRNRAKPHLDGYQPLLPLVINPPYLDLTMMELTPTIERLLAADGAPRTACLVVVPARAERPVHEARHVDALAASPLLRAATSLAAEEHSFATGHAHRRGRPTHDFHRCRWSTDVYLLANVKLPAERCDELLDSVAAAFRVPLPVEGGQGEAGRRRASTRGADSGAERRTTRRSFSLRRGRGAKRNLPGRDATYMYPDRDDT